MYKKFKIRVFNIIEGTCESRNAGRIFEYFIMSLVVLNVVAVALETENALYEDYESVFRIFEMFSVAVFTLEYAARVWVCTEYARFRRPIIGRLKFILTPMSVIDLLAIVPFYLSILLSFVLIIPDWRFIRAVRLFRLFRLLKLGRYSDSLKSFVRVFKSKKEELTVILFIISIALFVSSSIMYFVENDAQPDKFSSIFSAMWWGIATLTTVGYGDIYPITAIGKILGSVIALLGIGMFALPAGMLASAFAEEIQKGKRKSDVCPHCGKEITGIKINTEDDASSL
ncbi:MAG: ion transporter [Clostridia bacterium]|nr:ion transporter [Clostridia bacterium]